MAFKLYPLFLLIPLVLNAGKLSEKLKLLVIGMLPYIITVFPYLFSSGFRSSALVAGQTYKSLYAQIAVSGGESIILFLVSLVFLYLYFYYHPISLKNLWQRFFLSLLLFFIFTHSHPQWFLWLTPFFVIELVRTNFRHISLVLLSLLSFIGLLFLFDSSLTLGLFAPILPKLYESLTLWQIIGVNIDYQLTRSLFHSLFVGSALYYIYEYFRAQNTTDR